MTSLPGLSHGIQMTPPQITGASTGSAQARQLLSLREIMQQQAQEGKLASGGLPSPYPRLGYDRLLQDVDTPNTARRNVFSSPAELKDARVREIGTPGPFEKSINQAQHEMGTITGKTRPVRNVSFQEVNRAAENIITSMSEEGRFVCLEVVKARLCKEFGRSCLGAMGFKRDYKDIPALNELSLLQAKVSTCKFNININYFGVRAMDHFLTFRELQSTFLSTVCMWYKIIEMQKFFWESSSAFQTPQHFILAIFL